MDEEKEKIIENKMPSKEEILEQLSQFKSDFTFGHALEVGNLVGEFVSVLFPNRRFGTLQMERQYTCKEHVVAKETRLDVYAWSESGVRFNLEMQRKKFDNLFKRASGYCAKLTEEAMAQVQEACRQERTSFSYDLIPDRYVIFICEFDLLKADCPVYLNGLGYLDGHLPVLPNGEYQVFVNLRAYEKVADESLRQLMCYIYTGKVEGDFVTRLHGAVRASVENQDWRRTNMTVAEKFELEKTYLRIESREEGREVGREEGREEGIEEERLKNVRNAVKKIGVEQTAFIFDMTEEEIEEIMSQ